MKTAVIIPTYNERENITEMIKSVSKVFSENSIDGTIIIVDDNSPDKTWEIAGRLAREYPVEVLRRTEDRGYGKSTLAGFKKAIKENYEIIFTMDCDFSHEPKIIPFMIKKILEGNHVAVGSRRIKGGKIIGWNAWRHFCSFGAMTFSKIMLGLKTKDITSGFRAYKKEVLKTINLDKILSNGYSFLEELLYNIEKKGFKVGEVPITFLDRKKGKSKLSGKEIIKFFITIFRLKFKNVSR